MASDTGHFDTIYILVRSLQKLPHNGLCIRPQVTFRLCFFGLRKATQTIKESHRVA